MYIKKQREDPTIIPNKDESEYWKNKIFQIVIFAMIIGGGPLMFYGAYMFYRDGNITYSIIEVLLYIIIAIVITQKSISVIFRKLFINVLLYMISILLLLTTGLMGNGMVFLVFSLVLTGCLLEKKQIILVISINILIFIVITALLMQGYFDGTDMEKYKNVWCINLLGAQASGIVLLVLMNIIYSGLENQYQLIKNSKERLIASEIKHKAMIANISDVIVIIDESGIVTYNSPNMESRFGWMAEEILNKPLWDKIHLEDRDRIKKEIKNLVGNDRAEITIQTSYLCKRKQVIYIELTAVNLIKDSNVNGILINYHDITECKRRENEILHLSYHDCLTGLFNRTYFEQETGQLDTTNQLPLSVITGDVNGLKIINDALGHAEGDKLLVTIARILDNSCRKGDVVARIGGDEFCILLPKTTSEGSSEIIKKIDFACKEYNDKMSAELYYISISLGAATKIKSSESLATIFRVAEDNMYKGKLLVSRSYHSSILNSMKTALYEKSQETEEHAQRLITLSKAVGRAMNLTGQQFLELELFATLHDIGKIGIDDRILNKPGKLSDLEWSEMKKHSEVGYRIAMASPELVSVANDILTHHERWDGTGYPQQLVGENIPLLSRILAVADAFDAMTEDRS